MSTPKCENAPAGQGLGREKEAAEAGNFKADHKTLVTRAHQVASNIPYLMTREAKRAAVGEFLAIWLQLLRGELSAGGH